MSVLTTKQISLHLKTAPDWSKRAQTIHRTFEFKGFLEVIEFVNRIARKFIPAVYNNFCKRRLPENISFIYVNAGVHHNGKKNMDLYTARRNSIIAFRSPILSGFCLTRFFSKKVSSPSQQKQQKTCTSGISHN